MMKENRRRSPESSRHRRRERLHSSAAEPAVRSPPSHARAVPDRAAGVVVGPSQPYASDLAPRARAHSSSTSSSSSSTSNSLLNISAPKAPRSGFFSFFRAASPPKRRASRKRKTRFLRFGNSSSSSVDEGLAYGRGYISKDRVAEVPAASRRHDVSDPYRPAPPRRVQTDEEIIEIGRQLARMARDENKDDLARLGRRAPSQLAATANAINKIRRHGTNDSVGRGVGSSTPHRHRPDSSGEDSEWESAYDDEDSLSDDAHSALAYGSKTAISLDRRASMKQSYRNNSVVDPNMFGPINSLRGFINTPCGFDDPQHQHQ